MSAQLRDGERSSTRDGKGFRVPASAEMTAAPSDAAPSEPKPPARPPAPARRSTSLLSRGNVAHNAKDKGLGRGLARALSTTPPANVGLDPLSTKIFLRTNSGSNNEQSIAQRLRNPTRSDSPTSDNYLHDAATRPFPWRRRRRQRAKVCPSPRPSPAWLPSSRADAASPRKGSSLLSRLGMRGARKDNDMSDSDSDLADVRTDGSNARATTSVVGAGGGYIPLYKEPPLYIRVRSQNKKTRGFNRLFLAQELLGTKPPAHYGPSSCPPATAVGNKILKAGDAIWAAEFSLDGRYLAVAGKDQTVHVFSVISTPEERRAHEQEEEEQNAGNGERLSAPVFHSKPTHEFQGHLGEVLALSWSKNNFLLSSSMDKTVRLWHMSRSECLCVFKHNDLVTSIAFHPTDDRFFLAGSLDVQLRLWSIPDKTVAFSAHTNEFITAVAFSPDGKTAICGLLSGQCIFYETEGLKVQFQIHVRSSRGRNAKGSKITGISTAKLPPDPETGDVKVLISSNDSRVRIYSLKTRMLEVKFRGLVNQSSQIHARFSDDGMYVISGSEDRRTYIWDLGHPEAELKDKHPCEYFDAHPEVVTTALMAPVKSRQLLSASGDPIYDLCNPPPVMLLSLDEKSASQTRFSDAGHAEPPPGVKKPEETPAYIERCKHPDGNIIITTDKSGTIKVLRQDCAFVKRQQNTWETGSKFSGKLTSVGRSASVVTKTSGSSHVHSRRGSVNQAAGPVLVQLASDRIMSWRQDIEGRTSTSGPMTRSDRSMSPTKMNRAPPNTSAANLASEARKQPYVSGPAARPNNPSNPTSVQTSRTSLWLTKDKEQGLMLPPTPSFSLISASDLDPHEDKAEGGFWNLSRWKAGLAGLRYPVAAAAAATAAGGTTRTTQSDVLSSRTGSESSMAEGHAMGRRSVNEHRKSRLSNDGSGRKLVGPVPTARPRSARLAPNAANETGRPTSHGKTSADPGAAHGATDRNDGLACVDGSGRKSSGM